MQYISTRGGSKPLSSAEVIKMGLAPDGGLFVPEEPVLLNVNELNALCTMDYRERAVAILKKFLSDYTEEEIRDCVGQAYAAEKFGGGRTAPLFLLNENVHILELWHGPTCAFKDMALQILPHLLVKAAKKTGETDEIAILVATSGDTGKAALEGFKDVEGTRIIVFFPEDGVSEVQKRQMITQEGKNVASIAVAGNFDDTQNGVKEIFSDAAFARTAADRKIRFSSANSINWGRLVPQIVYYFSAYADALATGELQPDEKINIVVPTGNFGNILAGYYAMQMGLPVNRLICASNDNNVLTDFINTGTYNRNRDFKKTISPSMDILISSNLERLLFELTGHDAEAVCEWMKKLKDEGAYTVDAETRSSIAKLFWAGFSTEDETMKTIESVYKEYNYVVDTHTAVGIDVYDKYVISTGDMTRTIIASTASPFKFNENVTKAIFGEEVVQGKSEFELLKVLSEKCGIPIPEGLSGLETMEIRHKGKCAKNEMKDKVKEILGI